MNASNSNPTGQGEYIWSSDNTRQGLTWFGTSAMAMRRQDGVDIRPYTLLSGWASFIPGVKRTQMTIEQGGPPVFGEDNLSDPWSSQIIRRIQNGFSPVLVADKDYWESNKMSNTNGDWPSSVPAIAKGATRPTTLLIFNDTFSGTSVDVTWEIHSDSPTGTKGDSGTFTIDVPLGYHGDEVNHLHGADVGHEVLPGSYRPKEWNNRLPRDGRIVHPAIAHTSVVATPD